jgi:hypothetical protein
MSVFWFCPKGKLDQYFINQLGHNEIPDLRTYMETLKNDENAKASSNRLGLSGQFHSFGDRLGSSIKTNRHILLSDNERETSGLEVTGTVKFFCEFLKGQLFVERQVVMHSQEYLAILHMIYC